MKKPRTIITVRQLGGIGDCLMLTPVFRGLREKYPKAKIMHVTGQVYLGGALMDIFTHVPRGFIDEIHPIEPYDCTPQRTKDVWRKFYGNCPAMEDDLWYQMADMTFDLNTPCVDYEWGAMRSPEGIQKPRYQIWCEFAGVRPSSYRPMYEVKADEDAWASAIYHERGLDPSKVIGIGAAACDKRRAVGVGKLHDLCTKIQHEGFTPVIIDPTFNFPDFQAFNGLRLSKLMALVNQMRTVISVDSGLLHMAGTLNVPVVGIFGPTDAKMRMGQYLGSAVDSTKLVTCAPCWYDYPCTSPTDPRQPFACLNKLSVDVILEETLRWTRIGRQTPIRVVH